jgi:Domain of unknown function (DUF4276)
VLVAPIVEGHGEVQALPGLLHRIAAAVSDQATLRVNNPIRVKSGSFLNDHDYFTKMVSLAGAKAAQSTGSVLILLDCDDGCPATLGPDLLSRAQRVRGDVSIAVVLAVREYETWFVTAARSLRGQFGLPDDFEPPGDPSAIRDAKGWLGRHMNAAYDPIVHQLDLSRKFDLQQARANRSFDRLYRLIERLIT